MDQQINSTNLSDIPLDVQIAKSAVTTSANRLDSAIESLANKVQGTSVQVREGIDTVKRSRDELLHAKETAISALEPIAPYVSLASNVSRNLFVSVRQNPAQYAAVVAGLIGGLIALRFMRRKTTNQRTMAIYE